MNGQHANNRVLDLTIIVIVISHHHAPPPPPHTHHNHHHTPTVPGALASTIICGTALVTIYTHTHREREGERERALSKVSVESLLSIYAVDEWATAILTSS